MSQSPPTPSPEDPIVQRIVLGRTSKGRFIILVPEDVPREIALNMARDAVMTLEQDRLVSLILKRLVALTSEASVVGPDGQPIRKVDIPR